MAAGGMEAIASVTCPSMARFPVPLVSSEWLAAHRDEVVVADVRSYLDGRSGRAAFEAGHIPGAVFLDLDRDLSDVGDDTAGRHPLPSPEAFAEAMGAAGVGDYDAVVAYDDSGGGTAGRLVWMLRVLGRDAALLDGGLRAWDGATEAGPSSERAKASFTPTPWPPDSLAGADEVAALATTGGAAVLDARAPERFRGETEPVDRRAGRIPGARNLPWTANLDRDTGRFLGRDELRARFAAVGVDEDTPVVAYCGSGVSACADLLALEAAGLPPGRLFVASWSGWSADPARPVATGSDG
jgi:thiosulfate/3-mercaptopyruvate sulfurtransferase